MKPAILFGASRYGIFASYLLAEKYEIAFFCDNDSKKWGTDVNGIEVISPDTLKKYVPEYSVIVTSTYKNEIIKQLWDMGIDNCIEFKLPSLLNDETTNERVAYDFKEIDLSHFLLHDDFDLSTSLTLYRGGSGLLDYLFLKALVVQLRLKTYLEIGTFLGESISVVSDYLEKCFSISLPDADLEMYFSDIGLGNFGRYFSKKKSNVTHYEEDSITFDYKKIKEKIDLVFVDGDHSYPGAFVDTKKLFLQLVDRDNTLVVWHDFDYPSVKSAISNSLGYNDLKRVYKVFGNSCAIYVPDRYIQSFSTEIDRDALYTYHITIDKSETTRHTLAN